MGIRSPFDADSSSSHLVDKMVGNAYPVVRAVYSKLDDIAYLAGNAGKLLEAGNAALNTVEGVAAATAALDEINSEITALNDGLTVANGGLQELQAGVAALEANLDSSLGSNEIGHTAAGAGSVTTTVGDKLREVVSVTDKGASPDNTEAENTAAFIAAGAGAYIPEGTFAVDPTNLDVQSYHGPGSMLIYGNIVPATSPIQSGSVGQRLLNSPTMGDAITTPEIYPNAGNATQGICVVEHNGQRRMLLSQRVDGASWGLNEEVRFSEWLMREDGGPATLVAFSEPLSVGHGADLSALVLDNNLYLYTSAQNPGEIPLADTGYDIYLCAGQSNMVGYGTGLVVADTVANPLIDQYAMSDGNAFTPIPAVDPLQFPPGARVDTLSPASKFARDMVTTLQGERKILLLPVAVGGTSLIYASTGNKTEWSVDAELYAMLVKTAKAALNLGPGNRFAGMIWSQGESDRFVNGLTATQFRDATANMLTRLRSDLDSEFPIVISGMSPEFDATPQNVEWAQIELGLSQVPSILPNSVFVPGPAGYSIAGDTIHFTAAGNRLRGASFATAMKTLTLALPVSLGGKGVSKIHWKGALTEQADVQTFQLFGEPGDSNLLNIGQRATAAASTDGAYLILVATSNRGTGRFLYVYDRREVEAAVNPRAVRPVLGPRPIQRAPGEGGSTLQGLACDGRQIYTVWGVPSPRSQRTVQVYDMGGTLLRSFPYSGPASLYSDGKLKGVGGEVAVSFEPEGVGLMGDELIALCVDTWRIPGDIVSFSGSNWAYIGTAPAAGILPTRGSYWVQTSLPTTLGAWSAATEYSAGAYTRKEKRVFGIANISQAKSNTVPQGGLANPSSGTPIQTYAGTDAFYNRENGSWTLAVFDEALGGYTKALEYNYDNCINIFSTKTGELNNRFVTIRSTWGNTHGMQLRSSGGKVSEGAYLDLLANTSPSGRGEARLSTITPTAYSAGALVVGQTYSITEVGTTDWNVVAGTAGVYYIAGSVVTAVVAGSGTGYAANVLDHASMRLQVGGLTKLLISYDTVATASTIRPLTTNIVSSGTATRYWSNTYTTILTLAGGVTINTGTGSPEGVVAAVVSSLYTDRTNGVMYIKNAGAGNTGWKLITQAA